MGTNRKYVQFSKKIVVGVSCAVTALCCMAIWLCWSAADASQIVAVTRAYIEYATIVFVAYSGNSVVEKWLTHRSTYSFDDTNNESEV